MVMQSSTQLATQLSAQPAMQPIVELPAIPPVIQSAYADTSFDCIDNLVNDCEGSAFCDIPVTQNIDPGTQDPDDPSNLYDVIITLDALNDCHEFDDRANFALCINSANYFVGPVEHDKRS